MVGFDKNKLPSRPKILLIKLRSIGDVIYNTAVYTPLKQYFHDSHLTVLVERPSYDLVRNHPDVDEVLCFDKVLICWANTASNAIASPSARRSDSESRQRAHAIAHESFRNRRGSATERSANP